MTMFRLFVVLSMGTCVFGFAAQAQGAASVARSQRAEVKLESSANYTNPVQQATLTATFTSPSQKKHTVYGFWDGDKVWKIRFAPNETGKWTYTTACSDAANTGLHAQAGELTCTDAKGDSRFAKRGAIRVAPDGRYLAHDDGTPFFYLGDTAWNGALLSSDSD